MLDARSSEQLTHAHERCAVGTITQVGHVLRFVPQLDVVESSVERDATQTLLLGAHTLADHPIAIPHARPTR